MMTGPIRGIARDHLERRDDVRVATAWVGTNVEASANDVGAAARSNEERGRNVAVARGTPVLVMLLADHAAAMTDVLVHGSAGERVYLLVPRDWSGLDARVMNCPKVLIRRVPEVPIAGTLRANLARLWMGGAVGGKAPWPLDLDTRQADAFRHVFLRLFWHDAIDEAWTGGRTLSFRTPGGRPFEVPEVPRSAPVQWLETNSLVNEDMGGALVHMTGGSPPTAVPRRLWFPAGGNHHERLAGLLRDGTDVVWEDRELPDLVVGVGRGVALLPGSRGRLRIDLNATQAAELAGILQRQTAWRFEAGVRLGDHAADDARFWLKGGAAAAPVEREQGIDLPDLIAEGLRAVPDAAPSSWPAAQPLSLAVRYRWTALPPRIPAGSAEDPLIEHWRKVDDDWASRLEMVRQVLQAVDEECGRVERVLSQLKRALLGFGRTRSGLLAEVEVLEKQSPSAAGPSRAPAMLHKLTDIEGRSEKLQKDLADADRDAREKDEREKQEAAWRARVDIAKRDLTARQKALANVEAQRAAQALELASIEGSLRSTDKATHRDLQVRKRRVSDDTAKLERESNGLRSELASLEPRTLEVFAYKPRAEAPPRQVHNKGRFVPPTPLAKPTNLLPEEGLPEVGRLRRHLAKRYLVIEVWEDLDRGEQAAVRLRARLVAPEST